MAHAETTAPNSTQVSTVRRREHPLGDDATQVFEMGELVATVFGFKGTITSGPDVRNYYIVTSGDENRFVGASALRKAAKPDTLQVGDPVIVITDFASDGSSRTPLKRGLKGVVKDMHEGDAYVKFDGLEQLRVFSKNLHKLEKIKAQAQSKVAVDIQPKLALTALQKPEPPRTDKRLEKAKHEAESQKPTIAVQCLPSISSPVPPLVLAPPSRRQRQLCCCA